jgi:hypothetical protein
MCEPISEMDSCRHSLTFTTNVLLDAGVKSTNGPFETPRHINLRRVEVRIIDLTRSFIPLRAVSCRAISSARSSWRHATRKRTTRQPCARQRIEAPRSYERAHRAPDRSPLRSQPGHRARKTPPYGDFKRGERWGSNPRPPGPQPGALPTELRPPRDAARRKSSDDQPVLASGCSSWLSASARL